MTAKRFTLEEELQICKSYKSGLNTVELGDEWNCNPSVIEGVLKRNDILIHRKWGEKSKIRNRKFTPKQEIKICRMYEEGLNAVQLGNIWKCSDVTIGTILKRNKVRVRKKVWSEETKKKISQSHKGKKLTMEHKIKISKKLKGRTFTKEVRKKIGDAQRGPNSVHWKGGISFEPYCELFNDEFKERVRNWWDRKCGICGKIEKDNNRRLSVHHVTYDKEICCNDSLPLFIPLCQSCHSKTNYNQNYWYIYLSNYIMIYLNGQCYIEKEVR